MADADDLLRCLAALQRCQAAWLDDLGTTCPNDGISGGDPAFAWTFRRWQEELAQLHWHLRRCENRLLHVILSPAAAAVRRDVPASDVPDHAIARSWVRRMSLWFEAIHLEGTYRRIDSCRDLDEESINADIATDLATWAELATITAPVLDRIAHERDLATAQDLAFYGVISPWRVRGIPALLDVMRWLSQTLEDEGEW